MAISLGGILLASQALNHFVAGLSGFFNVLVTGQQVVPLFEAAKRGRKPSETDHILPELKGRHTSGIPLLAMRNLNFRFRDDGDWILDECDLEIQKGDRLLLEGPSGSGKSTLTSILSGLQMSESGDLFYNGVHQRKVGLRNWRRQIVMAPQFHENHVFTETFLFNLLMGRTWPPTPEDIQAAKALCEELGLGELLERMPAGLLQMVGESGWQLSHGERSRLFIARAILQGADLIILDESFGALDPENLKRSLECVFRRAPTLLVIAHP